MKRVMILGAGLYQVPLIETAKRMGLETVVVSVPGPYKGFSLADRSYYVDTRDREQILEIARSEQISGICTTGTDVAVRSVGYACEKMGLNGISLAAADVLCDKALMKEAFLKGGVSCASGGRAFTAEQVKEIAEQIGYPVVVKRVDSSGSRGITVVYSESELEDAYQYARRKTTQDYVVVERFLRGTEIGVDGYIRNGRVVFCAPHAKFLYRGQKTTVPMGHGFPLVCSSQLEEDIANQMQLAADATGADNCCFNADVMTDGDRAFLIEMGGRCGATCIPELIGTYYGIDYYEAMLTEAMGSGADFSGQAQRRPCMAKLLCSPKEGIVTDIDEELLDEIRKDNVRITIDPEVGGHVFAMSDGTDRIGSVLLETQSENELDDICQRVRSAIRIDGRRLSELWKG